MTDPFATPAKIASEFPTAASFRGRLVLIQPTVLDLDVPNKANPALKSDRMTATVTVVDGAGPIQLFSNSTPTGKFLQGPEFKGVYFSQDRIIKAVLPDRVMVPGKLVLARIETFKPGGAPGKGNPWGLVDPTPADADMARAFLANRMVAAATAPSAGPAPDDELDPFQQ